MIPTLANSGIQIAGSDSETYVKPGETPVSPVTPAIPIYRQRRISEHVTPTATIGVRSQKFRRRPLLLLSIIVLVLALFSGLVYAMPLLFSGKSITTVKITPSGADLKNNFTISAVKGIPDPANQQVGVHVESATTLLHSKAVNATSTETTPGTHAKGFLYISNYSNSPMTMNAGLIIGPNSKTPNIELVLDETVTIPSISGPQSNIGYVPAHAVPVGSIGNIPFESFYYSGSAWEADNYQAFTGGQDPQTYTVVQQSDIDNAANALEQTNPPDAQQMIQPLVHANERLVGTPACKPNVTSDRKVGDKTTTVTVSVSYTCTGEVYDYGGARAMAAHLLTNQANTQLGSGYAPVGNIKTTLTSATLTDAKNGTVTLLVDAEGVWAYQFTDAQKQALAMLIAGKTKSEAQSLLASQKGVGQVVITLTGGNSDTLPTDVKKITILIQNASG